MHGKTGNNIEIISRQLSLKGFQIIFYFPRSLFYPPSIRSGKFLHDVVTFFLTLDGAYLNSSIRSCTLSKTKCFVMFQGFGRRKANWRMIILIYLLWTSLGSFNFRVCRWVKVKYWKVAGEG